MARVSERNHRFRTKAEIADDVAFILNAPIHYGTKYAVLKEACWVWTEYDGKYEGCRYWSKGAILARALNKKTDLRHEHIVPKKVVIEMLFQLTEANPQSVFAIMDRFLIGVVVLPEEDELLNCDHSASMPPGFFDSNSPDFHEPWLRYVQFEDVIEIIDCKPRQHSALSEDDT